MCLLFNAQESENLPHWLYYHYRLGFHRVFVVSNDCNDSDFAATVAAIAATPVPPDFVHLIDEERCAKPPDLQARVYRSTVLRHQQPWLAGLRNTSRAVRLNMEKNPRLNPGLSPGGRPSDRDGDGAFLYARTAFIDVDEYVVTRHESSLRVALAAQGALGGGVDWAQPQWTLLWRTFGTSGWAARPAGRSALASFILRVPLCEAPPDAAAALAAGSSSAAVSSSSSSSPPPPSLLRSRREARRSGGRERPEAPLGYAHRSCNERYLPKRFAPHPYLEKALCDSAWLAAHGGFAGLNPHYCVGSREWTAIRVVDPRQVWLNHYTTRSQQEWEAKLRRGRATGDGSSFFEQQRPADVHNAAMAPPPSPPATAASKDPALARGGLRTALNGSAPGAPSNRSAGALRGALPGAVDRFSEEVDLDGVACALRLCRGEPCCQRFLLGAGFGPGLAHGTGSDLGGGSAADDDTSASLAASTPPSRAATSVANFCAGLPAGDRLRDACAFMTAAVATAAETRTTTATATTASTITSAECAATLRRSGPGRAPLLASAIDHDAAATHAARLKGLALGASLKGLAAQKLEAKRRREAERSNGKRPRAPGVGAGPDPGAISAPAPAAPGTTGGVVRAGSAPPLAVASIEKEGDPWNVQGAPIGLSSRASRLADRCVGFSMADVRSGARSQEDALRCIERWPGKR